MKLSSPFPKLNTDASVQFKEGRVVAGAGLLSVIVKATGLLDVQLILGLTLYIYHAEGWGLLIGIELALSLGINFCCSCCHSRRHSC